jgi:hypothetical protein
MFGNPGVEEMYVVRGYFYNSSASRRSSPSYDG